ncbi:hypothetical protein LV476_01800 [Guyparkeria hydrothermalis]|uniref:hypothetical protein n=1 Tax=Guyparkeria hydrothermalis TaxID=923 RepID=UPI002020CE89|nr:hypothetical protein [Guyparkeria hydrothermalis]MCL7743685.1 hypothetical protein [Guyparkeria hydrothermalis]
MLSQMALVGALNAVVMLIVFLRPEVSQSLYEIVLIDEKYEHSIEMGMRNPGLFYTGFSILSLVYSLLFIIQLALIVNWRDRVRLFDLLVLVLLFMGMFFSGRAGFVVALFGVVLFLLLYFVHGQAVQFVRSVRVGFYFLFLGFGFSLVLSLSGYAYYLDWFFELFINFYEEGRLASKTTDTLLSQHYFLPGSASGVLFGVANFGRQYGLEYIPSDVGYVLFIHGLGVVGLVFSFGFFLLLSFLVFSKGACLTMRWLFLFVVLGILIGSFKDYYFLSHMGYTQILFLLFFAARFIGERAGGTMKITGPRGAL